MNIVQRGNPNIMSKIREGAKVISESKGLAQPLYQTQKDNTPIPNNINEMFGNTSSNLVSNTISVRKPTQRVSENKINIDYESSMITRVLNTLDTLSDTKEYFNAIQDLMALYVSGKLDNKILSRISDEDMKEIKGILREFKSIIDSY